MNIQAKITKFISSQPEPKRFEIESLNQLISQALFFHFGVDTSNQERGENWKNKPLIIAPLIVAFGTLLLSLKYIIQFQTKIMNDLVYLCSIILFIISIWMGIILGLNGTMWK